MKQIDLEKCPNSDCEGYVVEFLGKKSCSDCDLWIQRTTAQEAIKRNKELGRV